MAGRAEEREERKKEGITIIAISLLSPPLFFFLRRGYSECQLCSAAAVQCTLLQRSQPHCTPSTPLNCQLWQSILSLVLSLLASGHSSWLQEDKRSSTESVHRSAAPSCLAAAPAIQSAAAAAAGEGGLFHCCHRRVPLHHAFFFTSSFLSFQPYRHIRP